MVGMGACRRVVVHLRRTVGNGRLFPSVAHCGGAALLTPGFDVDAIVRRPMASEDMLGKQ